LSFKIIIEFIRNFLICVYYKIQYIVQLDLICIFFTNKSLPVLPLTIIDKYVKEFDIEDKWDFDMPYIDFIEKGSKHYQKKYRKMNMKISVKKSMRLIL